VKAPPFLYVRARSVADVVDLLHEYGDNARVLAGGQSLLPSLALRLSQPSLLVDVNKISELRYIYKQGETIHIGALTRHSDLECNDLISTELGLIAQAVPHIAHVAIRNRGTIAGSVALADPAAELPACLVALDATIVVVKRGGERRILAKDFFKGLYETDLHSDELIVGFEISTRGIRRQHFEEISRRRGDFAIVGLAACAASIGDSAEDIRLVYFNCGGRPMRAHAAETAFRIARTNPEFAVLRQEIKKDLDPHSDLHASAETRIHLATVLATRAYIGLMASGGV
jgi:carbon-monoxide dehydrogenase medium subunit